MNVTKVGDCDICSFRRDENVNSQEFYRNNLYVHSKPIFVLEDLHCIRVLSTAP